MGRAEGAGGGGAWKRWWVIALWLMVLAAFVWLAWLAWIAMAMVWGRPGGPGPYAAQLRTYTLSTQMDVGGRDTWTPLAEAISAIHASDGAVLEEWLSAGGERSEGFSRIVVSHAALHDLGGAARAEAGPQATLEKVRSELEVGRELARRAIGNAEADGLIDDFDRALSEPGFVPPLPEGYLFEMLLPELAAARQVARHLVGRLALARDAGDGEAYAEELGRSLRLASALEMLPVLISRLVAVSIRSLTLSAVVTDVRTGALDAEACRRALEALRAAPEPRPMVYALGGEQLLGYSVVQMTHTDDGSGDGRPLLHMIDAVSGSGFGGAGAQSSPPHWANAAGVLLPTKKQTMRAIDTVYEAMIERARLSAVQRRGTVSPVESLVEELGPRYVVVTTTIPAIDRAIGAVDAERALWEATRAMLAIEVYRASAGTPPASLAELTPEVVERLPTDPYADDGAFVYMRDSSSSLGYRLYSVGADGRDDGGAGDPSGDPMRALRDGAAGSDAVFVGGFTN